MPKNKKKLSADELATKGALWMSRETNVKYVEAAFGVISIAYINRTAVRKAVEALGYDKPTAKKLRNGLLAIPFLVASSGALGWRAANKAIDAQEAKQAFDEEQKKNQKEFDDLPEEVKEAADKAAQEILDGLFGPGTFKPGM